jgi:hypothetical protein
VTLAFGVGNTIKNEGLNIVVHGTRIISDLVPMLPVVDTGLTPLLQ